MTVAALTVLGWLIVAGVVVVVIGSVLYGTKRRSTIKAEAEDQRLAEADLRRERGGPPGMSPH
jgi:hypothetical protein